MEVDLVVKGGTVVTSNRIFRGGVAIDKGKVAAVCSEGVYPDSRRVIDVQGKTILPVVIDTEPHHLLTVS